MLGFVGMPLRAALERRPPLVCDWVCATVLHLDPGEGPNPRPYTLSAAFNLVPSLTKGYPKVLIALRFTDAFLDCVTD